MKKIILIIISCFFFSCARDIKTLHINNIEDVINAKQELIKSFDQYGLMGTGVNDFYRHGYFIYALKRHNILERSDAENFLNALLLVKRSDGFYRRPDINDYMTRDDYLLTAFALFLLEDEYPIAKELLEFLYEHRHLEKDLWGFHHNDFFNRLLGKEVRGKLKDSLLYISALTICRTPRENTSDKLLLDIMLIAGLYIDSSNNARAAYNYCHSRVDYDYTVEYYYCGGNMGCNHPMVILLKGIL